jgi:hypothetical protein
MKATRLMWTAAVAAGLAGLVAQSAGVAQTAVPSRWQQPAASLADQIAAILGPGQARLTIRNLSTVSNDEIPLIRQLLVQDLKTHGITVSGAESANTIRVTLSMNDVGQLWVAEIGEGEVIQVAMVQANVEPVAQPDPGQRDPVLLRKTIYLTHPVIFKGLPAVAAEPVLAATESDRPIVLYPDGLEFFDSDVGLGLRHNSSVAIEQGRAFSRDPRGALYLSADKNTLTAFLPGTKCVGTHADLSQGILANAWRVDCSRSDDPWPIPVDASGGSLFSAFYDTARNYFTGVVTPSIGVDLPPFYSAALVPRAAGNGALLIGGIDGRVQLAENGTLKNVSGTRDWGSDFAALRSGCGAGSQIIASGSGEAANDSLRAYELPALEAVPASAPLTLDGTVTALWTAPDGKSVLAVVRNAANQYEVDRVTALCN